MASGVELRDIPKLVGRANYVQWVSLIKTYLTGAEGLWPITSGEVAKPEFEAVLWVDGRSIVQVKPARVNVGM